MRVSIPGWRPLIGWCTLIPAPWYLLSAAAGSPAAAAGYRAPRQCCLAAVMSWVEPGSSGEVHREKPVGSAITWMLPPNLLCFAEYQA